MAECLDREMMRLLLSFKGNWTSVDSLTDRLDACSDTRAQDVRELSELEFDIRLESDPTVDTHVMAQGAWWTIRSIAGGVTAHLKPHTEQRRRAERYGRVGMTSLFVPAWKENAVRETAASQGRVPTLTELECVLASTRVTPEMIEEHAAACAAGLVTLQFGWTPMELSNYCSLVTDEPRTESAEEYATWLEAEYPYGDEAETMYYVLEEAVHAPALPLWMEDLYRTNPGRFWWVMQFMVKNAQLRGEAAGRVLDRLTGGGLIDPDSLPGLLEACAAKEE